MATVPNRVRPGDLITSQYFNTIIDELTDLERRLASLENSVQPGGDPTGEGQVSISSFVPTADLRGGQELVIFGQNFGFSSGAQSVFFNSKRVTVFKTGSSNTKLIIEIPDVPGVTEAGIQVTMTVANFSSTDTRQLTLKPRQVGEQGNISLSFLDVTPTTIVAGSPPGPTFRYQLSAPILLPAPVTITPTISITGLQGSLQVLDVNGSPLPGNQITLQPGQTAQILVRAGVIPTGMTTFRMTVNAAGPGLQGSQDGRDFPVGTPIDPPDPSVPVLAFNAAAPPESFSGNVITRTVGATATIQLRAEFTGTDTRTYNVQVDVMSPATGWTAVRSLSPFFSTPASYVVNSPSVQFPAFEVTAAAGATTPATVEFTLQRVGSSLKKTVQYTLIRT